MAIALPRSGAAAQIFYRTFSHAGVVETLKIRLREGMSVIDIGAHAGEYTLIAAKLVGPTGRVYAFEPQPRLAQLIRLNVARNDLENVEVQNLAVADSTGTKPFEADTRSMGGWIAAHSEGTVRVRCTTLDEFASRSNCPRINLIKIDAGSNELLVLRGGSDLLNRQGPDLICKLYHPKVTAERSGYDARMVVDMLLHYGYDLCMLSETTQRPNARFGSWREIRDCFTHGTYCLHLLAWKPESVLEHSCAERIEAGAKW